MLCRWWWMLLGVFWVLLKLQCWKMVQLGDQSPEDFVRLDVWLDKSFSSRIMLIHTSFVSLENFHEEKGIDVLAWPGQLSDLKPIEHCWCVVQRHDWATDHPPSTVYDLRIALVEECENIAQNDIDRLIRAMANHNDKCLKGRGGGSELLMCC